MGKIPGIAGSAKHGETAANPVIMITMSGEDPSTAESIQLHFCQTCGMSIPQADIEVGRAEPAPGGYTCPSCVIRAAAAPRAKAAAQMPARASAVGTPGSQALVVVFLIYVVGVTSFLLYREIKPLAPVLDIPEAASPRSVAAVDRKIQDFVEQSRAEFNDLQRALRSQHESLQALSDRLTKVAGENGNLHRAALERDQQLVKDVASLAERTLGLSRTVEEVFGKRMDDWRKGIESALRNGAEANASTTRPNPDEPGKADPDKTGVDPEVAERKRKVEENKAKLLDRSTPENARFTAAVELGDLKDPDAVDALIQALEKDKNGLVRRGAAWSLGKLGKHAVKAFPVLIVQVGGKDEYVAYTCDKALEDICQDATETRVTFNFDPTMKLKQRKRVQKQWSQWWEENKARLLPN